MLNLKTTLLLLSLLQVSLFAHGITIGSGTTFTGGSATISVSGNWSSSGTFTAGSSTVIFNGASGNQTITNSGGETFNNLTVNKAAGDVRLGGGVTVNGTLTVTSGDFDLNGYTCILGSSATLSETAGNTVKGTSGVIKTTRTLNAPNGVNVAGLGAVITSLVNMGSTVIERGHEVQSGNGNDGIERYYNISPATNSGLNATLKFYYDESELNGTTESELTLFRSSDSGVNWSSEGGTCTPANNVIEKTGISSFLRWTASSSSSPLPVELVAFDAETENETVTLTWQTSTEVNNYGFEIARIHPDEAGTQTEAWETIGFVNGHGNSNSPNIYSFMDKSISESGKYNYRLKQIDIDGTFEYSAEVEIEIGVPEEFEVRQNYPNPFNPSTTISFSIAKKSNVTVQVFNLLGESVKTLVNQELNPGKYNYDFDASKLTSGTYIYRVTAGNNVSNKKMILLK